MRLNLPLLKWGWRRLLAGQSAPLKDLATRSWEICPAERTHLPPAIFPDGALERVSKLSPWRSWQVERALIAGGPGEHAASRAYLVENADLAGAFLYRGAAKMTAGFGPRQLVLRNTPSERRLDVAHMVSTWAGSSYFANFIGDDLPLELLPPDGAPRITAITKDYGDAAGYRAILSLPRPPRIAAARIGKLTIYSDFAQNSSKAARYRILRQRLRAHFGGRDCPAPPGVYLKRGATGERRIVANETALEQALSALGFDIVEPAATATEEIARRLLDVPVVIGVEGSHLAHVLYTIADRGTLVVLQPPDRFALHFKEFADALGLRFAFVVGQPAPDGFEVDIDELRRLLERLA